MTNCKYDHNCYVTFMNAMCRNESKKQVFFRLYYFDALTVLYWVSVMLHSSEWDLESYLGACVDIVLYSISLSHTGKSQWISTLMCYWDKPATGEKGWLEEEGRSYKYYFVLSITVGCMVSRYTSSVSFVRESRIYMGCNDCNLRMMCINKWCVLSNFNGSRILRYLFVIII